MPKSINDILNATTGTEYDKIAALQEKTVYVPAWDGEHGLMAEYLPSQHPVMDHAIYPDIINENRVVKVTRVSLNFQKLAANRMRDLVCGIPVKRIYKPKNDRQKQVAMYLEEIFSRNRINSVNTKRVQQFFACCEIFTLWYGVDQPTEIYGFKSPMKVRCRTFTPMTGDELYPYFDEYGDMVAMSIGYRRTVGRSSVHYFDTYTENRHIKWSNQEGTWKVLEDENITLLKIPGVYAYREKPIWEDTSNNVYEMEWALSRNGNYLRDNSKPRFVVHSNKIIAYGDEKGPNAEGLAVMQFPEGSKCEYVTWQQATDSLKFHIEELRNLYFTQLQLPDWSYEKMSQQALSGESRKQLFIDAKLKVTGESGPLQEFFDREVNVVKAFLKLMLGAEWHADIDAVSVETKITPFSITDDQETVNNLLAANGNKPLLSHRESIERLGWSDDPDKTLQEINEDAKMQDFGLIDE